MFIEIINNKQGIPCALVRYQGEKGKIHTLKNLGLVSEIDALVLERLITLANQGSVWPIKHSILNQDLSFKKAIKSALTKGLVTSESYDLLEEARSNLNKQEQLQIAQCYLNDEDNINDVIAPSILSSAVDESLLLKPKYQLCLKRGIVDAVVVAAGIGSRMGAAVPKQYLKLGNKTILEHTVLKLLCCPYVRQVVLVLNKQDSYFQHTCLASLSSIKTVVGGQERVDSVLQGLSAVESKWCLVHDAARPFVSFDDLEQLLFKVALGVVHGYCGGILACKVADTLKKQETNDLSQFDLPTIDKSIDRSHLYRAQTPQLFNTYELSYAIKHALQFKSALTDEASALEAVNRKVLLVPGSECNFKITEPSDLLMAQALLEIE